MNYNPEAPLKRIQGESQKANDALHDYWLMGAGRSLRKLQAVYKQTTGEPPTRSFNTLHKWSRVHNWQARIAAQKEIDDALALEEYRARHMGKDEVLARLADMARGNLADFPSLESLKDLEGHPMGHVVKKFKVTKRIQKDDTEIINVEIELNDPQAALGKLGKHHGLFKDHLDITTGGKPFTIDDLAQAEKELADWENGNDDTDPTAEN